MPYLVSIGFLLLAALHLPPSLAAVRPAAMAQLYGPAVSNGGLGILLHHRAIGFVLVMLACAVAAFWGPARPAALVIAGWSMTGYLLAYWLGGSPEGALQRIAVADLAGIPVLLFLVWAVALRA